VIDSGGMGSLPKWRQEWVQIRMGEEDGEGGTASALPSSSHCSYPRVTGDASAVTFEPESDHLPRNWSIDYINVGSQGIDGAYEREHEG
jgi:hypothetical protein